MVDIKYDAPDRGTSAGQYAKICLRGSGQLAALIQGNQIAPGIVADTRRALMIICLRAYGGENLPIGPLETGRDTRCDTIRQDRCNSLQMDTLAS